MPAHPNNRPPQFDIADGKDFVVPHPRHAREDIQEPFVREQQIDPNKYYPKGYQPHLLEKWSVDGDLIVPMDSMPENMVKSMSGAWSLKILDEQSKK